jgi:hypothetical protein
MRKTYELTVSSNANPVIVSPGNGRLILTADFPSGAFLRKYHHNTIFKDVTNSANYPGTTSVALQNMANGALAFFGGVVPSTTANGRVQNIVALAGIGNASTTMQFLDGIEYDFECDDIFVNDAINITYAWQFPLNFVLPASYSVVVNQFFTFESL